MRSSALWRIRPYVRPYRGQMVFMTFAALVGLVASTLIPEVSRRLIDGPLADGDRGAVIPLALVALALGLLDGGLAFARRYILSTASIGMETDLRNDVYRHLQRLPIAFHDGWQSGQLLSRAMADINAIRRFVGFGLVFLVVNILTLLVVLGLLANLHVGLMLVVAAGCVPLFWLGRSFAKQYHEVARRLQDQEGDLTTVVEEGATGIRIIKAFGRHRLLGNQFHAVAEPVWASSMDKVALRSRFFAGLGAIPNTTLAAVLLFGAIAVENGSLTVGGLFQFVLLVLMLVWPVEAMGEILAMGEEASTAAERIFEVLDTEPAIADRPGARAVEHIDGHVRFEVVHFTYPNSDQVVLAGVDLDIVPGETMAIVGMTGSGKTTLASLVPRLYDVSAGRVTIDGVDVRDMQLSSLRHHVGVAFEDPTLFSASVRENLLLGHPDATDDDIERALSVAQATFVHELPWGLDTRVGEQGLSLSGGQRQRLALARAVIGRPTVLVLDDPLSALDVHTEALVEDALRRVLSGVTALLVVHRPSTLALADRVALLDGGRIAAVGTHSELMASNPTYRSILSQESEPTEEARRGVA